MSDNYRTFFGFTEEPFTTELDLGDILETEAVKEVKNRFDYIVRLGAIGLVTGEIGSGKSTALRHAAGSLHPSEYQSFYVTASSGSILELYRQILHVLGVGKSSTSRAILTTLIKQEITELVEGKKLKVVLIIDEASLLRLEVFTELHTICQFKRDSKQYLPIILAGQANLVDKLMYRASAPLASRIIARSHLEGLDRKRCEIRASLVLREARQKTAARGRRQSGRRLCSFPPRGRRIGAQLSRSNGGTDP